MLTSIASGKKSSLRLLAKSASLSLGSSPRNRRNLHQDIFQAGGPSQWQDATIPNLSKQSLTQVLAGEIPATTQPGFVTQEHCQRYEDHLKPKLTPYSHIAGPRVDKVGLAQFEFQAQSAEDFKNRDTQAKNNYFSGSKRSSDLHARVAESTGDNAWDRIVKLLKGMFPEYNVSIAQEPGYGQYHGGIYRSINNSTPIHCDWSPYDSKTEDWIINRVTRQAVFNLYLAPMVGGETTVYDRQWTDDVLEHRDPATYGYFPSAVQGRQHATIKPGVGDLVFFNTRNLHRVNAVDWELDESGERRKRDRLTLSAFIGALPAGITSDKPSIILWS